MKKYLVPSLKILLPLAIIAWLVWDLDNEQLANLWSQPKEWPTLAAAFAFTLAAVCTTFVRWYLLVAALEMPFRLRDALRLSFLSYLLNFVSLGAIGGDLFKAVFIAREQPGRRAQAVATVVVDRIAGLYGLFIVASLALLLSDMPDPAPDFVVALRQFAYWSTVLGAIGLVVVMLPGFTSSSAAEFLMERKRIGPTVRSLVSALRMYRRRPLTLAVVGAMSLGVHLMFATSFYLIAQGLFREAPALSDHLIISPLALLVGGLPIAPAGVGAFEGAMAVLYAQIPAGGSEPQGLLVAFGYRLATILVAMIGVAYYLMNRREVREIRREAERMHEQGRDTAEVEAQEI